MVGREDVRDDRVLGFTRGLSLFIVPFLLVAFVILYLFPGHTDHLWAWTIPVSMTSMVLASAYLGGAYFFLRVLGQRRWSDVRAGFPPVAMFSGLLGVATVVHWDKFAHGNPAFWIWAGLYFTAPLLVLVAFVRNQRYAGPPAPADVMLPTWVRTVTALFGAGSLVMGATMFLAPGSVIGGWPWALTPLTCRVLAAVFCLASAGVVMWLDPRWLAVRLMAEVTVVMLLLMVVAAVRAHDELDASQALAWPLAAGVAVLLAGAVALLVRYRRP